MKAALLVAFGSGLGGVSRYAVNLLLANLSSPFPFSTWVVNSVGAFIMGFVFGLTCQENNRSSPEFLMLTTGYLGGLTTFSTFTAESATLLQQGKYFIALGHSAAHILASLALFFMGFWAGKCLRLA